MILFSPYRVNSKKLKAMELNSHDVKLDWKKLRFYTMFVNPDLFDIRFDYITSGQMPERKSLKMSLNEFKFVIVS